MKGVDREARSTLLGLQDNELQGTIVTRLQRRVDGMQKIALKVCVMSPLRASERPSPVCPHPGQAVNILVLTFRVCSATTQALDQDALLYTLQNGTIMCNSIGL